MVHAAPVHFPSVPATTWAGCSFILIQTSPLTQVFTLLERKIPLHHATADADNERYGGPSHRPALAKQGPFMVTRSFFMSCVIDTYTQ